MRSTHGLHQITKAARIDRQERAAELEQALLVIEDLARAVGKTIALIVIKRLGERAARRPWATVLKQAEAALLQLAWSERCPPLAHRTTPGSPTAAEANGRFRTSSATNVGLKCTVR